jgi:hypothetical protein
MQESQKLRFFRGFLITVPVGVLLGCLEVAAWHVMVKRQYNFYLPLELNEKHMAAVRADFARTFDPALGWEPTADNPDGYVGKPKDLSQAAIALFGDSYTLGNPQIDESWAAFLEQRLGRPVLNYGVAGYGTDQALLRFEKRYVGQLHTPYVFLGVLSENVARILNRYRGFYFRKTYLNGVKPRFELDTAGHLQLIPCPLQSVDDLPRLLDAGFRADIGAHDYWYQVYEREGLNRTIGHPYAYYLVRALPFYVRTFEARRLQHDSAYKHLYENGEACELMRKIVLQFVDEAKQQDAVPIVLFFPAWQDMLDQNASGTTVYAGLERGLRAEYELTFDAMNYFAPHLARGEAVGDFFKSYTDGHYNTHGEAVVSEGFYDDLMRVDAHEHRIAAP